MARPLLDIHCIREESCKYPVALKVAMDDGTVQTYNLSCPQPSFAEAMKVLSRMSFHIGYQFKPKRNRIPRWQRRTRHGKESAWLL